MVGHEMAWLLACEGATRGVLLLGFIRYFLVPLLHTLCPSCISVQIEEVPTGSLQSLCVFEYIWKDWRIYCSSIHLYSSCNCKLIPDKEFINSYNILKLIDPLVTSYGILAFWDLANSGYLCEPTYFDDQPMTVPRGTVKIHVSCIKRFENLIMRFTTKSHMKNKHLGRQALV